jgi:hypothetical protein
MEISNFVKCLQDIMRNDVGINGDAQRIEQMTWIQFLNVDDAKEQLWEFHNTSIALSFLKRCGGANGRLTARTVKPSQATRYLTL